MSRPKVLVLSGSPFHLTLMGDLLDANDLRTIRAPSLEVGLESLRRERPALAVVDLDLRGTDKQRFLDACRSSSSGGGIPVVLVADANQSAEAEALLAEVRGRSITKPIDTGRFPRAVLHQIRGSARREESMALL